MEVLVKSRPMTSVKIGRLDVMKKILFYVAAILLFAACAKDDQTQNINNDVREVAYTFIVSGPAEGRATLSDDATTVSWEVGDEIGLFVLSSDKQKIQSNRKFVCQSVDAVTGKATFSGTFLLHDTSTDWSESKYVNSTYCATFPYVYDYQESDGRTTVLKGVLPSHQSYDWYESDFDYMISDLEQGSYAEQDGQVVLPSEVNIHFSKSLFTLVKLTVPAATAEDLANNPALANEGISRVTLYFDCPNSDYSPAGQFTMTSDATSEIGHFDFAFLNTMASVYSECDPSTHPVTEARTYLFVVNSTDYENYAVLAGSFYAVINTNSGQAVRTSTKALTFAAGSSKMMSLGGIWSSWVEEMDLSIMGAANCYAIAPNGRKAKFRTDIKGNGNDYVNTATTLGLSSYSAKLTQAELDSRASAEVLWQRDNATNTNSQDIISACTYSRVDQHIHITPGSKSGNAVVALKNSNGDIIWSWHIWVTPESVNIYNQSSDVLTSHTKIMKMNLGADLEPTTNGYQISNDVPYQGLYYQWGRKDPFYYRRGGDVITAVTIDAGSTSMLEKSIRNPMQPYVGNNNSSIDWFTSDKTISADHNYLWGGGYMVKTAAERVVKNISQTKTMFDPCPYGYRVPSSGLFGTVDSPTTNEVGMWYYSSGTYFRDPNNTVANGCYLIEAADEYEFFPAVGYYSATTGGWKSVSDLELRYWYSSVYDPSSTEINNKMPMNVMAGTMYIKTATTCEPFNAFARSDIRPLRCVSEDYFNN